MNITLAALAAGLLVYSVFTTYEWRAFSQYAKSAYELGRLSVQVDMRTGFFTPLTIDGVNQAIRKLMADAKHLGYRNADTLRYYGIKPWEDYKK